MASTSIWSAGRYEAVAERIAVIAAQLVAAVDQRAAVRDAAVVDLACGTGSAALAAAGAGARVTGVDITPELLAIAAAKAQADGHAISFVAADAAATGLPAASADAVVSNMGIIFVEPVRQVAEIARLLRPGGIVGVSSWVRGPANPFYDPIVKVLGAPPTSGYSPDQWGQPDIATDRLSADFDDVSIESDELTWQFDSPQDALHFIIDESPMHVDMFSRVEGDARNELIAAFDSALRANLDGDGHVAFPAPYVVITARRRA